MRKIVYIILFISIILTTIVYSAFSTQLQINGEAIVRSDNDIRVTNLKFLSQTNGAYETYNNKYTKDTTSMFVTLPSNSSATYEIEISNKSNLQFFLKDIIKLSNTSENLSYSLNIEKNNIFMPTCNNKIEIVINNASNSEIKENLVLKFLFKNVTATFLSGSDFNKKLKKLSNPTLENIGNRTYVDNVKKIMRSDVLPDNFEPTDYNIVSATDSDFPIYAWFDNDTIYYYSIALNPLLSWSASYMFSGFLSLDTIDIKDLDTSKVIEMSYMFFNDASIKKLDLSSFNTKKVSNMGGMFELCESLENLNLKSFNTENVMQYWNMFDYDKKLVSLNLENFDMSKCASIPSNMFRGLYSLEELKTPKVYPNNLSITLPKTLYDGNNNSYTTLDSTSPTQTWLRVNN